MPPIIFLILVGLNPTFAPTSNLVAPITASFTRTDDMRDEYERRLELARGDVKKLSVLYSYCQNNNLSREGRSVLRAILRIDSDDVFAHEELGHTFYDDQWFTSKKKLKAYKDKREVEEAEAKGWVRYQGEWMDPQDVENIKAGLVRDEDGVWVTEQVLKYRKDGWIQFDLEWIPPAEQANIEKGLFKCGESWLGESDANQYHRLTKRFWTIPSEGGHFIIHTTLDREQALVALDLAEQGVPDLVRLFGRAPEKPVNFAVLRSLDQYGRFAAGGPSKEDRETEVRGLSSLYGAYFADVWIGEDSNHMGAGVAYWDHSSDAGDQFGKLFLRNAAALSFVEGLDSSPVTIAKLKATRNFDVKQFFLEKRLPEWIRRGAAAYVERYRLVNEVGTDPLSLRRWAISNVKQRGGLDDVSKILAMKLSVETPGVSEKFMSESGLLVAFILDGKNADVKAKHSAFVSAFSSGGGFDKELLALEDALKGAAAELQEFAKL